MKLLKSLKLGVLGIVSLILSSSTLGHVALAQISSSTSGREWQFGQFDDLNSDGWPDDWSRRSGDGFPKYTSIGLTRETTSHEDLSEIEWLRRTLSQVWIGWQQKKLPWTITPESAPPLLDAWLEQTLLNPYLQFEMDGGAAEVQSPLIEIDPRFDYGLQCSMRFRDAAKQSNRPASASLHDYRVWASIRLLDSEKKLLSELSTAILSTAGEWQTNEVICQLAESTGTEQSAAYAQVTLHVQPRARTSSKVFIDFDSVRLHPLPKLALRLNQPNGLYYQGETVEITARVGSSPTVNGTAHLLIRDHLNQPVLDTKLTHVATEPSPKWGFSQLSPGFYEVRLEPSHPGATLSGKVQSFVILDRTLQASNSRFGISDPNVPESVSPDWIARYTALGCNQLKVPVIGPGTDSLTAMQIADQIDSLQRSGFRITGIVHPFGKLFTRLESDSPTEVPVAPPVLALNSSLQILSARISRIQFGSDTDTQLQQSTVIQERLNDLELRLEKLNPSNEFITAIDPLDAPSEVSRAKPSRRFQLHSVEELTANETRTMLNQLGLNTWFSVSPIPRSRYSTAVRVDDLFQRMLIATSPKLPRDSIGWIQSAEGIEQGVFTEAGQPTAMFAPFRNLNYFLENAEDLGVFDEVDLPPNKLLRRKDKHILVFWGEQPTEIKRYLGRNIRVCDVWGREVPYTNNLTRHGFQQMFVKDRYPVFVEGIDEQAARWRMGLKLTTKSVAIQLGIDSNIQVDFANPESHAIQGTIQLESTIFASQPAAVPFSIGPQAAATLDVPVRLSPFAEGGPQPVSIVARIDQSDAPTYITIDRNIHVGSDQFSLELDYYFDDLDNLVVLVDLTTSAPMLGKFDCFVSAPGRTRKRLQFDSSSSTTQQKMVFEQGSRLIGQPLWIQAEQLEENLILNRRVQITKP